ncbi:Uncharacterized protein dnl_16340 [Desulfonema limicola]|uniref:Uncharacterized protein n=1 Tax=Desulfonema limicola TaxID=45656 RepID=A0A975B5X7_9BACT|nr:Uncharacterized protein dnl_16340 [Desulfonema limicola]
MDLKIKFQKIQKYRLLILSNYKKIQLMKINEDDNLFLK